MDFLNELQSGNGFDDEEEVKKGMDTIKEYYDTESDKYEVPRDIMIELLEKLETNHDEIKKELEEIKKESLEIKKKTDEFKELMILTQKEHKKEMDLKDEEVAKLKKENHTYGINFDKIWNSLPSVSIAEYEGDQTDGIVMEIKKLKEDLDVYKEADKYDDDTMSEKDEQIDELKEQIEKLKKDYAQTDRRLDRAIIILDMVNQSGDIYSSGEESEEDEEE